MDKRKFLILVSCSFLIRIIFAFYYPLIGDELNFWNYYYVFPDFSKFWEFFTRYDTQQPLFYLMWFEMFRDSFPKIILRLPSILFIIPTVFYWNKLFDYKKSENQIPWFLFLFAPFLSIYSTFFLPYSMMVMFSVMNFYYFKELRKNLSWINFLYFLLSGLFLIFVHYYGALQVILLTFFLAILQKNLIIRRVIYAITFAIVVIVLRATDFKHDFAALHPYRKFPTWIDVAGYFNLLIGGRFIVLALFTTAVFKKIKINFKSIEMAFIIVVMTIALLKTFFISPSLEARYLLILIYPLYFMFKGFEFKNSLYVYGVCCLLSFYVLINAYGPAFVTDYSKIERHKDKIGLLATPCPKFYFRGDNYICHSDFDDYSKMTQGVHRLLIQNTHMKFFIDKHPKHECKKLEQELFDCTY